MARSRRRPRTSEVWSLSARQHGVVTRGQLIGLGFSASSIGRRAAGGSLHRVWPGVYAVGRPTLGYEGTLLAAALACGRGAMISHRSAARFLGLLGSGALLKPPTPIDASVPLTVVRRHAGIVVHRRTRLRRRDRTVVRGVPVTAPGLTLVDLASKARQDVLEAAVSEADRQNLIDPDSLRAEAEHHHGRPGAKRLAALLDRGRFRLTDSELERRFLRLVARAGLPRPRTGELVNGFAVDFHWPHLGLVAETDGLRYHRTARAQARDRVRDQAHTASGLTTLRFTHAQVANNPDYVRDTLATVATRLGDHTPTPGD
ncbi:type IV toxin-antitoxin system AbiEi family antitoxin domain-containing protein [soil metagenome]